MSGVRIVANTRSMPSLVCVGQGGSYQIPDPYPIWYESGRVDLSKYQIHVVLGVYRAGWIVSNTRSMSCRVCVGQCGSWQIPDPCTIGCDGQCGS